MALFKEIVQDDGVTTNYHRILFLTQTVNRQNSIAVLSYVNADGRQIDNQPEGQAYKKSVTYETDYDDTMTIETAYDYLKTLPEFEGSEDV